MISNNQVCTLWNPIGGNVKNDITNSLNNGGGGGGDHANETNYSENSKPKLSEDYAELGLADEEGDYSTPAGNYKKSSLFFGIYKTLIRVTYNSSKKL